MQPNQERARTTLAELFNQYKQLTPEQRNMVSEADVIQKFIERLLGEVLGWPIHDLALYRKEVQAKVGRPDIVLYEPLRTSIEKRPLIYVEAKRFGLIDQLQDATKTTVQALKPYQLSLPGMATDRTKEEQQAINYAFQNNGEWAILTNYERLRLFNARRDWVVVSFEQPEAYLDDFDTLWQLSYENILNGSLDRLSNQRYIANIDSEYLQLINNWRERLANDLIANEHENTWLRQNGFLNVAQLRHVVQRVLDRLVVIRFAEDHYVLPAGGLRQISEIFNVIPIYTFSMDEHLSFFFRSFDRRHNSALFAKDIADQARFTDATLLELVADLYKARYRAMPADILGNTYEQFLGKTLVLTPEGNLATRDNLETRKKQGSYYTSTPLVRHLVDNSLGRYLYATENGRPNGIPLPNETPKKIEDIYNLRILDAACGSGSFLISVYYILADFYRREITRIEQTMLDTQQRLLRENATQFKIQLEIAPYQHQLENLENYPRLILERHLYGVDLDPQAAEIAVVNLMMRSLENRNKDITKIHHIPLLLNQNVKVGNSLVGAPAYDPRLSAYPAELASLIRLRAELVAIDHNLPRHDVIVEELATLRATLYSALEPTYRDHFTNLERVHLFHWGIEFPEVFYRADGTPNPEGGFQVVVGNPPWEILKPEIREYYAQFDPNIESKYKRAKVEQVIEELNDTRPDIQQGWQHLQSLLLENGAYFKASPDYTHQGRGDTALHKLFIERVFGLLAHNGRLGYLVPSGIYSHRGTQPLREWLFQESQIEYLYGLANVRKFFPDVDSRFKFTLLGLKKGGQTERFKTLFLISHAEWPHTNSEANASTVMERVLESAQERILEMDTATIRRFSPNSLSIMEFKSRRDYALADKIYSNHPLLGDTLPDTWNVKFTNEFHMTNDRHLFNTHGAGLPLYEGKMIHQFDAYWAPPKYWVKEAIGEAHLVSKKKTAWFNNYRFVFRDITNSTNERTTIVSMLPPKTFAGNTLWVGTTQDQRQDLFYTAICNSFCFDWVARLQVDTHMNLSIMEQLPMPRLKAGNPTFESIVERATRLTCTHPDFAQLWESVMGTAWDASQAVTEPLARQALRDELDALVARLYGLSRSDFDHLLGTFPQVFPPNEQGRDKRERLLSVFDSTPPLTEHSS